MALQAFIDDSGRGQDPAFVLAGWIASPEQWAEFSDEWKKLLHQSPRIEYFKMREAWWRQGQFSGWEITDRNQKVAALYPVIERFAVKGINIVLPSIVFRQYSSLINHRKANEPYFLASFTMMVMISQSEERCGIAGPVDFIFDRQQELEIPVQEAWDELARMSPDGVPRNLGERPQFNDDKVSMPLQAADLHAWWVRRAYDDVVKNMERTPFMWSPTRYIECIHIVLDENNVADFFGSIATATKSYERTQRRSVV